MRARYIVKRVFMLILVVWTAATINFIMPRLMPFNPVEAKMHELIIQGGANASEARAMIEVWEKKFGLDQPAWKQYLNYMSDVARFDLGYSLTNFPKRVSELIAESMPWTLRLLVTSTLISYVVGSVLGAHNVSIASCMQKEMHENGPVQVVMMTHDTEEAALRAALAEVEGMEFIKEKTHVLRVL